MARSAAHVRSFPRARAPSLARKPPRSPGKQVSTREGKKRVLLQPWRNWRRADRTHIGRWRRGFEVERTLWIMAAAKCVWRIFLYLWGVRGHTRILFLFERAGFGFAQVCGRDARDKLLFSRFLMEFGCVIRDFTVYRVRFFMHDRL